MYGQNSHLPFPLPEVLNADYLDLSVHPTKYFLNYEFDPLSFTKMGIKCKFEQIYLLIAQPTPPRGSGDGGGVLLGGEGVVVGGKVKVKKF